MTADTPRLRLSHAEWDAMTTVLGILAVGAEAALHRDQDIQVITSTGEVGATITPADAPQLLAAWRAVRHLTTRHPAAPPREGPH